MAKLLGKWKDKLRRQLRRSSDSPSRSSETSPGARGSKPTPSSAGTTTHRPVKDVKDSGEQGQGREIARPLQSRSSEKHRQRRARQGRR